MENYTNPAAYPDSVCSSPRSRDIDPENASWDEPTTYKIKLMCSYGGKIQPRPHDNQLTYVGGDTKILSVDRNIKFSLFISKLSSLCDANVCFKYQLPGEDLDALISVTNDDDLEHMMLEYDRIYRGSAKPARLRLFLFPLNPPSNFSSSDSKSQSQWFVDALNAVQIPNLDESSSPSAAAPVAGKLPDSLFGLDKGHVLPSRPKDLRQPPAVPEVFTMENRAASECGSEDRYFGDPGVSPAEIQRQIHELRRMKITGQEQVDPRGYNGDYYGQKIIDSVSIPPPQQAVPVNFPASYLQERNTSIGGYSPALANEQPFYVVPTSASVYQAPPLRPVTGQPYIGMQRMVPEVYRDQPVYSGVPQQPFQQPNIGGFTMGPGVGVTEHGYAQVGYDAGGRPVYFGMAPPYQSVNTVGDGRQGGGVMNQDGKMAITAPQTSSI